MSFCLFVLGEWALDLFASPNNFGAYSQFYPARSRGASGGNDFPRRDSTASMDRGKYEARPLSARHRQRFLLGQRNPEGGAPVITGRSDRQFVARIFPRLSRALRSGERGRVRERLPPGLSAAATPGHGNLGQTSA